MEVLLNLDKEIKYLIGVSGGSDSMMLLDLAYKQGYKLVVCHVNYHHRDSSNRDENIVKDYCQKRNIKVYVDNPVQKEKENFQKWARDIRYDFYKDTYDKENCCALLLAHQKDDHIENYLMSIKRKSHGYYYGIKRETVHHGMNIIRPLLDVRKKDTEAYCVENNIVYGLDESNLSDDYTRNQIRHQYIEKASDKQIENWLKEIDSLNFEIANKLNEFNKVNFELPIKITYFNEIEDKELFLRYYLNHYLKDKVFSSKFIKDLTNSILTSKKHFVVSIEDYQFVCEYDLFYLYKKTNGFSKTYENIVYEETEFYSLKNQGKKIEQLTVYPDDFPITVRSAKSTDEIVLRYGTKKLNRFFIDRKILKKDRENWPVVVNNRQEIIFVCQVGCNSNHFTTQPNLFVVK